MAVETELDGPPDPKETNCPLCGKTIVLKYWWFELGQRWVHSPPYHQECVNRYYADNAPAEDVPKFVVPVKFREPFEAVHFKNDRALADAIDFDIHSKKRVFAVIGVAGRGKSRLVWYLMKGFFEQIKLQTGLTRAPEVFSWPDFMTDPDPYQLQRMKLAKYVYIADIGSTDAMGRARAILQANIRYRIQKNIWTWLDIDDLKFDEDLGRILKNEAYTVWIDK